MVLKAGSCAVVLGLMLALAGTSSAGRGPERPPKGKEGAVAGEIIVVFRAGVGDAEREDALAKAELKEQRKLTTSGRVRLAQGQPGRAEEALKRLGSDPRVAYAEPNFVVHADATPNDSSFGQLWGLVNTGQTVNGARGTADADIDAELAWDVTTGTAGVTVGVIDTGVDFSHPELSGRSWINTGEDCTGCRTNGVDDDGNGYVDDWRGWDFVSDDNNPHDDHGHGTHVAGTIGAAGNNGTGVAGVNWDVRLAGLKFLDAYGSGTTADAIRALDYATTEGIRITNNSWGGGEFSQALLDAITRAGDAGGLVVAAAGNDGTSNDTTPHYPSSYESPYVASVAATDANDALAYFSNYGQASVDLGAPGVDVYSTVPGNAYDWYSGTSMATPHVAGLAALVKAAFPDATGMTTKALLYGTVEPKQSLAQTATGGRINAANAVRCSSSPQVWLEAPAPGFMGVVGEPLKVTALAASCASPAGVTVEATANGSTFTLTHRGDGFYEGSYTPTATGSLTIAVAGAAGGATVTHSAAGAAEDNYRVTTEPYAWIDATAGGTKTGLNVDDGDVTVSLPFAFSLYGESFTSVKISSNGYLFFDSGSIGTYWDNKPLPAAGDPDGVVAPLWDDLRLASRGAVWHRTVGTSPTRKFVVSWIGAPHYYDVGDATFQVVLEEGTNDVVFQYQDADFGEPAYDLGASATIGVESVDGARGRTLSHNHAYLAAYERSKAIRLSLDSGPPPPPDATPPAAPTGLTATAGVERVELDWADNAEADVTGYRVYRDGVSIASTSTSSYTDVNVVGGTPYAYAVTAVDAGGNESGSSASASATPLADTTAPAAPTGLTATAGNAQVALDWADNAEADVAAYRVYRDGAAVATVTASAYADSSVVNGTAYAYAVTAVDEAGNESAPSSSVSATPVAPRAKSYAPGSYSILTGSLYAGSVSSLAADDGGRLEIRSAKRWGWHYADYYASATISSGERATLTKLAVDFNGSVTASDAWLDFYVYDFASGAWEWVDGDLWTTGDRSLTWSTTSPARYVSSAGVIRFRVAGDRGSSFRTRSDLIRFRIEF